MPEPLGPSSATNSPASIVRLTSSTARTFNGPLVKNFDDVPDVVERLAPHSTVRSASAGRRRAARNAPAAPASRPPTSARPKPSSEHRDRERRRQLDLVGDRARGERAEAEARPCRRRSTSSPSSVGPNAPIAAAISIAEHDAEQPADDALRERLADDLPHDHPLRPAQRLQRPELADALPDGGEGQQRGEQERGERGEDRERDAEPVREVRRVDERAADLVGDLLRARDLRVRELRLDLLLDRGDRVPLVARGRARRSRGLSGRRASAAARAGCRRRRVWPPSGGLTRPTTLNFVPFRSSVEPSFSFCRLAYGRRRAPRCRRSARGSGRSRRATA